MFIIELYLFLFIRRTIRVDFFSFLSGVVEAYEKTIAETIADKENSAREYEKQIGELRTDRDLNAEHLASLEITFSDLHA